MEGEIAARHDTGRARRTTESTQKTFVVADRRADCKDAYFDCDDFDYDSADKLMIMDGEAKRLLKIASLEERYESFRKSQRSAEEQYELEVLREDSDFGKEENEEENQPGETRSSLQRRLREMEQTLTHVKELREKELEEFDLYAQLKQKDKQVENAQRQLREREQQLRKKGEQEENLQRQLKEMEQQLTNLQGRFREKEEQNAKLEGQLRAKERELNEHEIALKTALLILGDPQPAQPAQPAQRQQSPDWFIPGDQIQLTDKELGRGGWGKVVEGKYCGCAVAVKQPIHELIISSYNQNLFEREMDIASRCRHPCLFAVHRSNK
ncbi:hypothetical protein OS493_038926 [Desmophyllum pertusum]|uniref:Protein kinase domain-containing protein n=1 Tax=Desmophyllum pertusum TaxID=174260 RepID=A0A9X0D7B8_9CNID|nr:hypothetical protein OS493_038926 [Desmophyllum pertusum]